MRARRTGWTSDSFENGEIVEVKDPVVGVLNKKKYAVSYEKRIFNLGFFYFFKIYLCFETPIFCIFTLINARAKVLLPHPNSFLRVFIFLLKSFFSKSIFF